MATYYRDRTTPVSGRSNPQLRSMSWWGDLSDATLTLHRVPTIPRMKLTVGQSRAVGVVSVLLGVAWVAWEESAKAGYVASPPVTGLHIFFIAIGITFLFYPRWQKGK